MSQQKMPDYPTRIHVGTGQHLCKGCASRLFARIRELEAQLKTARQEALEEAYRRIEEEHGNINHGSGVDYAVSGVGFALGIIRALSRNEAQAKGGAHGE